MPASTLARVVGSDDGTDPRTLLARTLGASCKRRGGDLTDEQIYEGYAQGLEEALRFGMRFSRSTKRRLSRFAIGNSLRSAGLMSSV